MAGPKGKGIASSSIVVLRVIKSKVRKGGCVVEKIGVIFGKPRQTDRRLRCAGVAGCISFLMCKCVIERALLSSFYMALRLVLRARICWQLLLSQ